LDYLEEIVFLKALEVLRELVHVNLHFVSATGQAPR